MKILERYYKKIYKQTDKLLKKVFGFGVEQSQVELQRVKSEMEGKIKKPVGDITITDLIENKLSLQYCKYRTLSNILSVLSGALFLNSFCDEDIEVIRNEG